MFAVADVVYSCAVGGSKSTELAASLDIGMVHFTIE